MGTFVRDIRFAVRSIVRTPAFFVVVVLTLGLGIGATTAIFSVVNGVLLRPLPYANPERIVQVWQVNKQGRDGNFSEPNYRDLRAESRSFDALAEFHDWGTTSVVVGNGDAVRARHSVAARDFFTILGAHPMLGRTFLADEQQVGGNPAAIVSEGFWRRMLGGAASSLGTTLRFDGRTYTVVGVMPATVDLPTGTDVWTPAELEKPVISRTAHNWYVLARVRTGVTLAQARREASAIAKSLKLQYGDETWMIDAHVVPLREQLVGDVRPALLVLLARQGSSSSSAAPTS
jgi:hypothetical protein